jgi:hypothetical protein
MASSTGGKAAGMLKQTTHMKVESQEKVEETTAVGR